jgi:carbonic anhydrase/acetyltransferase-like protein (isoleucine patch superfamily)
MQTRAATGTSCDWCGAGVGALVLNGAVVCQRCVVYGGAAFGEERSSVAYLKRRSRREGRAVT